MVSFVVFALFSGCGSNSKEPLVPWLLLGRVKSI